MAHIPVLDEGLGRECHHEGLYVIRTLAHEPLIELAELGFD